jgi:WS/DGAT/MGAT family acyltransferase
VVEDKIDLDYHIRHAALPKPGGLEELRALVAELHAVPLDRARPLWEHHFVEGLEGGAFAVYSKFHHCMMDGIAGMATLGVTYDFEPGGEHGHLAERVLPPDVEPSDAIELTSTALGDFIRHGWRAMKSLPGVAKTLATVAPHFGRDARFLYSYMKEMPRTPFNRMISAHRVFATSSLSLPEVKAFAKSRGVTINDVVLALCAGALRRYLVEHGALPQKPLTAGVPVSVRPPGDSQLNNQVMFTLSHLPTDVAEPLPRLAAARAAGSEAKSLFADVRDLVTTDVSILGAPLVVIGLAGLWAGARAANYLPPVCNTLVSNVPGPKRTLYCVGAPATHYFPVSIPFHGCALNMTVHSYLDRLDFGLIACREAVPDAQCIADFIVEDFAAMREADSESHRPETIEPIAMAKPAPGAAHEPVRLAEASAPPQARRGQSASVLRQHIDALGEAIDALLSRREKGRPAAPAKTPAAKTKAATPRQRAPSKRAAAEQAPGEAAPTHRRRTQTRKAAAPKPRRQRRKAPGAKP